MIIGIGHDLTDIRRIAKVIDRFGDRFIKRCFTEKEAALAHARADKPGQMEATLAKRFAAKEACAKAFGSGIAQSVTLRDIEVGRDHRGKPTIILHGGAYQYVQAMMPEDFIPIIHLSLSDEPPYASAYVIIEACQSPQGAIMMEAQ